MADVYTVLFIVIGMLISLPGLLVALNLLLPGPAERIQERLAASPRRSFVVGVPLTAVLLLWSFVAAESGSGLLRGSAFLLGGLWMGLGTLGAAGLARLLGQRLAPLSRDSTHLTDLVRGAVVYELACLFPLVGWFLFAPITGIMLVGAAAMSLRRKRPLLDPIPADSIVIGRDAQGVG